MSPNTRDTLEWLDDYRRRVDCSVERISFDNSREWSFVEGKSALVHRSGRFYSIRGYKRCDHQGASCCQPLIHQPEVGTQGFVVRRGPDGIELLIQARTEPGNVGLVQLGPTIQATFSNYSAVHGGRRQPFLDHFHFPHDHGASVVLDAVQPELGTRFLRKRNRNIVIETSRFDAFDNPMFRWVSFAALAELMQLDHVVNNDARLVFGLLALMSGPELFANQIAEFSDAVRMSFASTASWSFDSVDEVLQWRRAIGSPSIKLDEVPLTQLDGWRIGDNEIGDQQGREFSVIQVRVHAADREVTDWDQPLIADHYVSRLTLVCREVDSVLNFLLRAVSQIGNEPVTQLQPTLSSDEGSRVAIPSEIVHLFADENTIRRYRYEGSDEGGRFYRCLTQYDVRWVDESVDRMLPPDYSWLTLGQIVELIRQTSFVSDELRSILSLFLSSLYCGDCGGARRLAVDSCES